MGAVQFDAIEAGFLGTYGGCDKVLDQRFDFAFVKRARLGFRVLGWPHRLFADQLGRGTDPGVMQLQRRDRAFGPDGGSKARQAGNVLLAEGSELTGKTLSDALHMRRTGHDEAKTT